MHLHDEFDWDDAKATRSERRHGVTFDQAMRVLSDPFYQSYHVEQFDVEHSDDEDRYRTTGSDPFLREVVLVIIWTPRDELTRIISARPATRAERMEYEDELQRRQNHS